MPAQHVTIGDVWVDVSIRETHGVGAEVTDHPVEVGANVADHIRPLPRTFTMEGLITNHPLELPKSHAGSARVAKEFKPIKVAAPQGAPMAPYSVTIEGEPSVGPLGMLPGVDQGVALLGALKIEVRSKRQFAAEQRHVNLTTKTEYQSAALAFTAPFDRVGLCHAALVNIVEASKLVTIVTGLMKYDSVALTDLSCERSSELGADVLKFSATARVLRIVQSDVVKLPDPVHPRAKPTKSAGTKPPEEAKPAELPPDRKALLKKIVGSISNAFD